MHVMSCWECVGGSVDRVLKYKQQWLVVTKIISSTDQTGSTNHIIVSYFTSYLGKQMIIAHLYFYEDTAGAGGAYISNGISMLTHEQRLQDFWDTTWQ